MSLKISSDLVVDVMRAAPPQRQAAATASLTRGSSGLALQPSMRAQAVAGATSAQHKAHQQFEAAMLRSFTEQMMPKEASSFYGQGTAANIWRSLQVDLMSQNLAKAGGIGIADMLDKQPDRAGAPRTAETLALNELGNASAGVTQLTTAADWPYFNRTTGDE